MSTLLTNLLSYHKIDEGSGTTSTDSANSYNMTFNGSPSWNSSGIHGKCLDFSSSTSNALYTTNTYLEARQNFSFSLWLKRKSYINHRIAYCLAVNFNLYIFLLERDDKNSSLTIQVDYGFTGAQYPTAHQLLTNNEWYHVVFRYNHSSSLTQFYVNGTYVGQITGRQFRTYSSTVPNTLCAPCIGNRRHPTSTAFDLAWNGYVDEVGLWTKYLSDSEIAELYNNGNGLPYPFDPISKANGIFFTGGY